MTAARIALVTGANKSIGGEIACQLGALDRAVWLAGRDEGRGRQAEQELRGSAIDAHFVRLDIADDASVRAAAARVAAESGHLHVLLNNAAIGGAPASRPSEEDIAEMRAVFNIKVFGTIRITQAFLPLLRKSDSARIVMLSSSVGSIARTSDFTQPIWGVAAMGYAASKTALNMITVKLAKELLAEGIKVNAACPSAVATDLNPHGIRSVQQGTRSAVLLATLNARARPAAIFTTAKVPALCGTAGKF